MSSTTLAREPAAVTTAVRRPRRRLLVAAGAVALLAAAGWYGQDWWTRGRFMETTDDAYVGGNVTPIAPHVAGYVVALAVGDNQFVRKGQLLLRIDPRDYVADRDRAAAALAARQAALDSLRAQVTRQAAAIRQAEADLASQQARAAFTTEDSARYRSLALTAAGSRQDAQRSAALDRQAQAGVAAATAGLDAAREQLRVLAADIVQADAAVTQARAALRTAELNLGYTEIRSPVDGYIGNRAAQVGAYVAAGAYLLSVIPSRGLWVDANFKEDQLARMVPGEPATVRADALPGHVFAAHVTSLAPGTGAVFSVIPPENATGNFTKIVQRVPVRVVIDGDDPMASRLRPGLSTTVTVDTRAP